MEEKKEKPEAVSTIQTCKHCDGPVASRGCCDAHYQAGVRRVNQYVKKAKMTKNQAILSLIKDGYWDESRQGERNDLAAEGLDKAKILLDSILPPLPRT